MIHLEAGKTAGDVRLMALGFPVDCDANFTGRISFT
jgi:hypothetical protein